MNPARSARAMEIPAGLAVPSACPTAAGEVVTGESIVGLVGAFMDAGAPRVLASLPKVDERRRTR